MNEHLAAIAAMLPGAVYTQAPEAANLKTSDGKWDSKKFPYTLVSLDGGRRSTERLAVAPHRSDYTIRTVAVGLSVAQAQAAVLCPRGHGAAHATGSGQGSAPCGC